MLKVPVLEVFFVSFKEYIIIESAFIYPIYEI